MTDPFADQAATTTPMADPFASDGGMVDPFSPLAGGGSGPGPRIADLDGRLVALRLRKMDNGQKYGAPQGVLSTRGTLDIAVLDGGKIYAPPPKDAPMGTPNVELGDAPMLFKNRFASGKGILNRFPAIQARFAKIPDKLDLPDGQSIEFSGDGTFILGRMGMMPGNKDVQKWLGLKDKFDEADLELSAKWLATNPAKPDLDKAQLFRTLVDVGPEARQLALKWVNENREFTA